MQEASGARPVLKLRGGEVARGTDQVVVEEPLLVRIDGEGFAVVMRTPGHDVELALGFLHAEGIVRVAEDILAIEQGSDDPADAEDAGGGRPNLVNVRLLAEARARMPREPRLVYASSSCGVCGRRTIEEIQRRAAPITSELVVLPSLLLELPGRLQAAQQVWNETGGLHAAALFLAGGDLRIVREDVGRHNAVDKIVGWALLRHELPLERSLLMVSGRCGFEIVHKAVLAGIPLIASVSAPSSLALELAQSADVTVVGFLRDGGFNVYTTPRRVTI